MKTLMNIFLVVPASTTQSNTPMEMNSSTWFIIGGIVALLLLIYLIIALINPEKF